MKKFLTIIIIWFISMGYGLKYRMEFKNAEDQLVVVNFYDRLFLGGNVYNIQSSNISTGGGFQYTLTWNSLPTDATGLSILAVERDTLEEIPMTGSPFSPRVFTVPFGNWHFFFIVQRPGGNETIDMDDLAPQITPLQPADNAYTISSIDNDDDKFKVVKGKKAVFRFLSDQNVSLSNFIGDDAYDDRYYLVVEIAGRIHFKGFMLMDDMNEPYLSPRSEVVIAAIDKLGSLKEEALVDFAGNNPRDFNTIAKYIAMALRMTGQNLAINVVMNIKQRIDAPLVSDAGFGSALNTIIVPYSPFWVTGKKVNVTGSNFNDGILNVTGVAPFAFGLLIVSVAEPLTDETGSGILFETIGGHLYNTCYLNAKTFEKEINKSVDCYRALEIMLGENSFITQEKGEWWIWRIDERQDEGNYSGNMVTVFDSEGNWIEDKTINLEKLVGRTLAVWPSNNATSAEGNRPMKYTKEIYKYTNPKEVVCNINFERGNVIVAPDLSAASSEGTYEVECWTMRILFGQPIVSTAFIKRVFEYGYEKERYLVITPSTNNATPFEFLSSEAIDVQKSDRASVSISFRSENNFGSGGRTIFPARIWLLGNDGNYYHWWHPTSLDIAEFFWDGPDVEQLEKLIPVTWNSGTIDESEWRNLTVDLSAIPVSGKLFIGLNQQYQGVSSPADDIYFQSLSIELKAFINGSYGRYAGHFFQVNQPVTPDGSFKANRETEVFMAEAPRKTFKGALFYKSGDNYELAAGFYDARAIPGMITDEAVVHPFGYLQAYDVFNQFRRTFRTIRLSAQGLDADAVDAAGRDDTPGLLHRFKLTDNTQHSNNKYYMLLSFDQNIKRCGWKGVLKEVYDSTKLKVYEGLVFGYIEQ